jgi:hypothetical protein
MDYTKIFSTNNPKLKDITLYRAEDKIFTEMDNETIILDIASGIYSGLNPVGTTIWNLLEKPVSIAQIQTTLLAEFDVPEDQCTCDLLDFLKNLAENQLIVLVDNETP